MAAGIPIRYLRKCEQQHVLHSGAERPCPNNRSLLEGSASAASWEGPAQEEMRILLWAFLSFASLCVQGWSYECKSVAGSGQTWH